MALDYTQPPEGLARELREVARDAEALDAALTTGLNFDLPPEFPSHQLLDICRSLSQLPSGTAEGCRAALEYARNRLPAVRREHVLSEEAHIAVDNGDAPPPVLRNSQIDERLRHLIASTTTALDEYRRLAAEPPKKEPPPEIPIAPTDDDIQSAVIQSLSLDADLGAVSKTAAEITNPNSPQADSLRRQLSDGEGLNRLARAELRMPRLFVSWYRQTVEALRHYPIIIRGTAIRLRFGADIAELGIDRWHDFQIKTTQVLIDEFRKTCDMFISVADILERRRSNSNATNGSASTDPSLTEEVEVPRDINDQARDLILSGHAPPSEWLPFIHKLEFKSATSLDLSLLAGLTSLRILDLEDVPVTNLSPLSHLLSLETLILRGALAHDLRALSGLVSLRSLNLCGMAINDISSLSVLDQLQDLDLSQTLVTDLTPLTNLTRLRALKLRQTPVSELLPLRGLIQLQELDLRNTSVVDLSPLSGLLALQHVDLTYAPVRDISPLSNLEEIRELNLYGTRVTNISYLPKNPKLVVSLPDLGPTQHIPTQHTGDDHSED